MNSNMDQPYQHDPMGSNFTSNNFKPNEDETMGGVNDSISTTPTGGYNNGYQESPRRQSAHSENYPPPNGSFSPNSESDMNLRSNSGYQHQPIQSYSRPSSGLSGSGERYGYSQTYQEQNQRSSHHDAGRTQSSVVIKVGMVGDAQIGKTSLMVKYVEGSWDEDYIQTLGMAGVRLLQQVVTDDIRCQFHGKDHLNTKHRNHILDLGFGRAARICQHATISLQRCRCAIIHVRPYTQEYSQFHQGVVSPRQGLQQDGHSFADWYKI